MSPRTTTKAMAAIAALMLAGTASAETLREALVKAYQTNPTLTGARAGQRANDENVPIARSRGLPSASTTGSYSEQLQEFPASATSPVRRLSGAIGVDVPLYAGGGIRSATRAAKARVTAGQFGLRGTESDVFGAVVTAYMDVLRDEAILSLNQTQVRVLKVNLEAAKDRFEVGDLTRTDVAQSEARLARAEGNLRSAEAQLISSRERYVQVVGSEPVNLEQPPVLPNLPGNADEATDKALADNPDLLGAAEQRKAAGFDVKSAKSQRLPKVQGVVDGSVTDFLGSLSSGFFGVPLSQQQTSVTAGVQVSVPLFAGGGLSAQVRQSQAREGQAIEQVVEIERFVVAQTRSAFASWRAANEVIAASKIAVDANKLALEGVRAENSVGTRSILDILDAEQELLNAQVQLVTAQRNAYVAGFQLLAAMGQAEYQDLGLEGGALYDPVVNYKRVKNKLWDWDSDRAPTAQSTRTVDSKPQTPAISGPPVE